MNREKIIQAALFGGMLCLSANRVLADADDATPPAEKVTTEVPVQVGKITSATLHSYIGGFGMIQPATATAQQPAAGAALAAPSGGVAAKVNVVEGQQVEKGDVLMELNSSSAQETVAYAEQEVARQKQLFAEHNTSQRSLEAAESQLALMQVIAPLSGTVVRLNVKAGEAVDASIPVVEVVDLKRLAVTAEIPAAEAAALKTGAEAQVVAEPPVTATLSFVSPTVDEKNGTVLVRALLPENNGLRPGQFVQLRVVTMVHSNCLAAPAESVVTDEDGQTVIAIVSGGRAKQQPVKTGLREDGLVEVQGQYLKEGDTIVTMGAYGLPKETKIKVVSP